MKIWNTYGLSHWPTVLIIAPDGKMLHMWEEVVSHKELETYLEAALAHYGSDLDLTPIA
jgi:hypothetical protein